MSADKIIGLLMATHPCPYQGCPGPVAMTIDRSKIDRQSIFPHYECNSCHHRWDQDGKPQLPTIQTLEGEA